MSERQLAEAVCVIGRTFDQDVGRPQSFDGLGYHARAGRTVMPHADDGHLVAIVTFHH